MARTTQSRRRARSVRRGVKRRKAGTRLSGRSLLRRLYPRIKGRGWYGYVPTSFQDLKEIPGHAYKFASNKNVQRAAIGLGSMAALGAAAYYGYVPPQAVVGARALIEGTNRFPFLNHVPGIRTLRRVAAVVGDNAAAGRRSRAPARIPRPPGVAGFRPQAMGYANNNQWHPR
jgi:hypothetical protein